MKHIMQVYELNADKYNSNVEDAGATVAEKPYEPTLADAVQQQVTYNFRIEYITIQSQYSKKILSNIA